MAHAFDNGNFIPIKKQTFFRVVSPIPTKQLDHSRENSPRAMNEEISFHRPASQSPNDYRSNSSCSYRSYTSPLTIEHCPTRENGKSPTFTRIARRTSINNENYLRRSDFVPQSSTNGLKSNTTYLNSTQLYISQPSRDPSISSSTSPPPPPPPPRQPLHGPTIPPRNLSVSNQRNSIMIPDFNSSTENKGHAIYRSPVSSLLMNTDHSSKETSNGSTGGEYFGECIKCAETITSLDDPCDILGQIYHSSCAVCSLCGRTLKNKYFYLKDEQLFCEEDFMYAGFHQEMENCTACGHLITDTIIQALGHSYHLSCFKCSKCSVCLDNSPFVTDQHRNLFCLFDYHMTYGARCDKCLTVIVPEDGSNETIRIVSMGKTYHPQCYRCEDCSMQLSDESDRRCYPLDEKLLCQECCARRRLISVHKF